MSTDSITTLRQDLKAQIISHLNLEGRTADPKQGREVFQSVATMADHIQANR